MRRIMEFSQALLVMLLRTCILGKIPASKKRRNNSLCGSKERRQIKLMHAFAGPLVFYLDEYLYRQPNVSLENSFAFCHVLHNSNDHSQQKRLDIDNVQSCHMTLD
mmetsp:Transcript_25559/g.40998  ORF Transcript_25559/g.40998 Transcript_25559/m.40998 type:complete len:106 (-) Transcript_25559:23-340(-)